MTIFDRHRHKLNEDFPIEITEEGIEKSFNDEHPQKMLSLIVLIEDRIETVFIDEHPSKAEKPIDVINEGIVIKK